MKAWELLSSGPLVLPFPRPSGRRTWCCRSLLSQGPAPGTQRTPPVTVKSALQLTGPGCDRWSQPWNPVELSPLTVLETLITFLTSPKVSSSVKRREPSLLELWRSKQIGRSSHPAEFLAHRFSLNRILSNQVTLDTKHYLSNSAAEGVHSQYAR